MFGTNPITAPKAFANVEHDKLLVTSIFYTMQGEGPFAGRAAVFVRLARCNLACSFCDTYFEGGELMSFSSILDRAVQVSEMESYQVVPLMVVTGGEPLLQPNLASFLRRAQNMGFETQIETNGTLWNQDLPGETVIIVSPKYNESGRRYITCNADMLRYCDALKFVVSASMDGYQNIPAWALDWASRPIDRYGRTIFLSPMNVYNKSFVKAAPVSFAERVERERVSFWQPGLLDMDAVRDNHKHAAALVMRYARHCSIRLSMQMHLFADMP